MHAASTGPPLRCLNVAGSGFHRAVPQKPPVSGGRPTSRARIGGIVSIREQAAEIGPDLRFFFDLAKASHARMRVCSPEQSWRNVLGSSCHFEPHRADPAKKARKVLSPQ